jgi:hypothetical protein
VDLDHKGLSIYNPLNKLMENPDYNRHKRSIYILLLGHNFRAN